MAEKIIIPSDVNVDKLPCPTGQNPAAWRVMRKDMKYKIWLESQRNSVQKTVPVVNSIPVVKRNIEVDQEKVEQFTVQIEVALEEFNAGYQKLLDVLEDEEIRKFPNLKSQMMAAMTALRIGKTATEEEILQSMEACLKALNELVQKFANDLAQQVQAKKQQSTARLQKIQEEIMRLEAEQQEHQQTLQTIDGQAAHQQANFDAAVAPKVDAITEHKTAFEEYVID